MNHSAAQKIYEEIRNEPYTVSTEFGIEAPNCYFKGIRLIKSLAELGYTVRGCVADIDWKDTIIPNEITSLIPSNIQERHFFVQVIINDQWVTLDPSIDPITAKLGFRMVDFNGDDRTCFNIGKIYTHNEQIELLLNFAKKGVMENYFQQMNPFLVRVNEWFKTQRSSI